METSDLAQSIRIAFESSVEDTVNLETPEGVEYILATRAVLFEVRDLDGLIVLQNGDTGRVESDAYDIHTLAQECAERGMTVLY